MKLLNVMIYILVYFSTMLVIIAAADWRLMIPVLIWLVLYILIQIKYVPQLKNVASSQADARSDMTGRIVDSYTNINTVKLFSHSQRESDYAQQGMDGFLKTVYLQMRLRTTGYGWFSKNRVFTNAFGGGFKHQCGLYKSPFGV